MSVVKGPPGSPIEDPIPRGGLGLDQPFLACPPLLSQACQLPQVLPQVISPFPSTGGSCRPPGPVKKKQDTVKTAGENQQLGLAEWVHTWSRGQRNRPRCPQAPSPALQIAQVGGRGKGRYLTLAPFSENSKTFSKCLNSKHPNSTHGCQRLYGHFY